MKTLRFWDYINGDWVKLSLKPKQLLRHTVGGPTDEGWASVSVSWANAGDAVISQTETDGVDCDGRMSTSQMVFALADRLSVRDCGLADAPGLLPEWERLESSQRDYSAEAMGY